MMSYINETDFVVENKKLVYPEIVTDGLQLYYDVKGKRDTDYHRDTMLDMSGNKNHGKLHNFAYEKHSGYKDGLVFDYIDDKLVRPSLNLKPDDFTFMLNGNIISFSPDGTVKRVQDGEVIESKGFNLVRNGDFGNGTTGWVGNSGEIGESGGIGYTKVTGVNPYSGIGYSLDVIEGHKYYTSAKMRATNSKVSFLRTRFFGMDIADRNLYNPEKGKWYTLENISTPIETAIKQILMTQNYVSNEVAKGKVMEMAHLTVIDLTKTFGAGNEPTKEQMDEIINRFGFIPNAQDLIDRVEYKGNVLGDMENIIDGLYKTEVLSGTEIFTDKADDAVVHVDIDGKSYQHAGSGKNLCHKNTFTGTVFSTTETTNAVDKVIEHNIPISPSSTYTLSGIVPSNLGLNIFATTTKVNESITSHNSMYSHVATGGIGVQTTNYKVPVGYNYVTITTGGSFQKSYHGIGTSLTWSNIQLEEGSVATAYEPPAPTPDYPIEINSLNDFDVVSSVGRENLQTGTTDIYTKRTYSGWGFYPYPNMSLVEGKTINVRVFVKPINLPIGVQFVHFMKNGGVIESSVKHFVNPGEEGYVYNTDTVPPGVKHTRVQIRGRQKSDEIVEVHFKKLKVEYGEEPSEWCHSINEIQYGEQSSTLHKINLLLSEPLRSVGDVKDRLFRDSDGLWKVERNVGEESLSGASNFSTSGAESYYGDVSTNMWLIPKQRMSYGAERTTHFKHQGAVWSDKTIESGATINANTQFHMRVPNRLLGIVSGDSNSVRNQKYKNWFEAQKTAGTPVIVQYPLETPTIETLPQNLQDKLNNLRSFQDSNYVYTIVDKTNILPNYVSENLKPTLHAKFLYNNWYKEDRVINNLMIYNRALTNEEMLQNYKTIKRRWGM